MNLVRLYGLVVDSDVDLHGAGEPVSDVEPDVVVTLGVPFVAPEAFPAGCTLLDFETTDPWYTLVQEPDGAYIFRIHSLCDFEIDAELRNVVVRMQEGVAPDMAGVLVTGALLSALLCLRGVHVFHGSAVEFRGRAVGFVGHSGQGKSTLATLFCSEGASAITDDVLVIDRGDVVTVRKGSPELRLRPGARDLVSRMTDADTRVSVDDRYVVMPASAQDTSIPLAAIVIPRPSKDGEEIHYEHLSQRDAMLALLAYPRLMGWSDDAVLKNAFSEIAALVARVPVFIGDIPWGPPFPEGLAVALESAIAETDGA